MKMIKIAVSWIALITLIVLSVGVLFNYSLDVKPVYSAGVVSVNISANTSTNMRGTLRAGPDTWQEIVEQGTADDYYPGSYYAGFVEGVDPDDQWGISEYVHSFNLETIPSDAEIISIDFHYKAYKNNLSGYPSDWQYAYYSLFLTYNPDGVLSAEDYDNCYEEKRLLAAPKMIWEYPTGSATWKTYSLYEGLLYLIPGMRDINDCIWVTFAPYRRLFTAGQPTDCGDYCYEYITFEAVEAPYITVNYIPNIEQGDIYEPINDDEEPMPVGDEVADNITWYSPRAAFSNEKLVFDISGESGANITLRCLDKDGYLLGTISDSVRINGHYYWSLDVPLSYTGWVRCVEDINGLFSWWGRIESYPSESSKGLMTYAKDMSYPQYDNQFTDYVVYKNGLMYVFWKTNVAVDETDEYELTLWHLGNESDGIYYNESLESLNENYYTVGDNNTHLSHYRYAIFTPFVSQEGFENYNGMVINLNQDYNLGTSGFIVPLISNINTGVPITECHSAYYYIQNAAVDGLVFDISNNINVNETFYGSIYVGRFSRVADKIQNLNVILLDEYGNEFASGSGTVSEGTTDIVLTSPLESGNYQVRIELSNNVTSPYYMYIHDIPIQVLEEGETEPSGEEGEGIVNNIDDWLENIGLNNTGGHWLALIMGMVALFLIAYRSQVLRVVFPLCLFASALIFGWVDWWYVALLGLGVGVFLFSILRKKVSGSGGD